MEIMKKPTPIRSAILLRVLPVAALVLLAIWFTTRVIAERAVRREIDERLTIQAAQAAETTSRTLMTLIDTVRGLALNDLLVNGLIDTVYRSNYLPLFFQSLRIPGPTEARITLTDYRGRGIVSNMTEMATFEQAPWLADVMEGREIVHLSHDELRIAMPILYSGLPEGVLVVEYGSRQVADILAISSQDGALAIFDSSGVVLFVSEHAPAELSSSDSATNIPGWIVRHAALPQFPGLSLFSAEPIEKALAPQHRLDRYLLLAMMLDLLALFAGISLTAHFVTKPLSTFVRTISKIGRTSDLGSSVPEVGPSEFCSLAQSFNAMFEELQKTTVSRDQLETLVQERTRELEDAQQELVSNAFLNAFLTGMATNSGMVLHNIGNAITPLNIQVEGLQAGQLKQFVVYMRKCYQDLNEHAGELGEYVTENPRGREVFAHLEKLIDALSDHDAEQSKTLTQMERTLAHISDILTLQQAYGANRQEMKEYADLNRLLEDAIRIQATQLERRDISIKKNLAEEPPNLLVDTNRLMQVVVNIIKNGYEAIDAQEIANAEREIRFRTFTDSAQVGFAIQDTGIGIEADKVESILELGKSGKGSSGFGLYYCKMFVEANSGSLSISSPGKGEGTTITVRFKRRIV